MATFTNKATLTYNGRTVDSNTVTGEIAEALTVYKTAQFPTYGDDPIVYIVTLVNEGAALTNLTLTDDLGGYEVGGATVYPLSYVDGSAKVFIDGEPAPDPTVTAENGLTISGIALPAGGSAVIVYSAEATEYAPRAQGEGITNTVTASGAGLVTPVSAEATVTAEEGANLSIIKSVSPAVVTDNGQIAYTFVIENSGNVEAGADANIVLSDLFSPILQDLSVTYDNEPVEKSVAYTYDESTGQFDTVAGAITVPAATVTQDPETGVYTVTPGTATVVVTGTV